MQVMFSQKDGLFKFPFFFFKKQTDNQNIQKKKGNAVDLPRYRSFSPIAQARHATPYGKVEKKKKKTTTSSVGKRRHSAWRRKHQARAPLKQNHNTPPLSTSPNLSLNPSLEQVKTNRAKIRQQPAMGTKAAIA